MFFISEWYILPAAFILDLILGDPRFLPHPVRWMGSLITSMEPRFRKLNIHLKWSGGLFALSLIVTVWAASLLLLEASCRIHPVFGKIIEIVMLYYCISTLSLKKAALDVVESLRNDGLEGAKRKLALIVGRDVDGLTEEGVSRATLETVAENLVDGVVSPLFFAGLGGAPFAMAYKMINTLDSMVGYKNERYKDFGMVSARVDDLANFIPARLSIPIIALANWMIERRWKSVVKAAASDGKNHSSPNAGYSEAAFAGALDVTLGGPNYYGGKLVSKPYICEGLGAVDCGHVEKAVRLMLFSSGVSVFVSMTMAHIMSMIAAF